MDIFVDLAAVVFPRLWKHLCTLQNIEGNRHWHDEKNIVPRKRHVLLQFLLLKMMSNFCSLKWWALIQGIGYNGVGVGRTALNVIKTFGVCVSASACNQAMVTLCSNLVQSQTKLFTKQSAVTSVLVNYGETVELLYQHPGRSETRLSGTHKMAIKVRSYTNTEFGDIKVDIKYTVKQVYPSPVMIADYENDVNLSDANFYLNHVTCDPSSLPCRNGSCVWAYTEHRDNSTWIYQLADAFEEETLDEELSSSLN